MEQGGSGEEMTLAKLRHDIRNSLNAIKLTSALLQRTHRDQQQSVDSLREIDRLADDINDLITVQMSDAEVLRMVKLPE